MLKKRIGYIVFGTVIGSILTLSTGVLAETSKLVSAYLGSHIKFEFNGEIKKPSVDKPAIIYKDSVYVPVRFIAEGADMPITWHAKTQTIEVKSPEPQVIEKIVYKDKEVSEEENEQEEVKDKRNYQTLPIYKPYTNMELTAVTVLKDENETKVFFAIENKEEYPLQLVQSETVIEVDGVPYKMSDKPIASWDYKWYDDIRKDETREGYIIFKDIPEDAKGIHMVLKIIQNDGSGKYTEVPFDIKVN